MYSGQLIMQLGYQVSNLDIFPIFPGSQVTNMVCFPIFPSTQVAKIAGFPIFSGSQVIETNGFPVWPGSQEIKTIDFQGSRGSQVIKMAPFQYFQVLKSSNRFVVFFSMSRFPGHPIGAFSSTSRIPGFQSESQQNKPT